MVRAVGDVGGVGFFARDLAQVQVARVGVDIAWLIEVRATAFVVFRALPLNHADAQPQQVIDGTHPHGVAAGKVIVDRDQMHAFAQQRVQIEGKRGDEGFPFAGFHLGDAPLMKHNPAQQLHIEVAHVERAARRLAHHRERLWQNIVQRLAILKALLEFLCFRSQLFVGQFLNFRF